MTEATTTNGIDLSTLPPPAVLEVLSFEAIFAEMVTALQTGVAGFFDGIPDFDATIESDPAVKVLQVAAYFRLLDRAKKNADVKACMIAYAQGDDLTNLGALLEVERLEDEEDEPYRERIVMAPDGYSVAGPEAAYVFHARSASALVRDATALSPSPSEILVTVLSTVGDGTASEELLDIVDAALSAKTIRPLTDLVTVQSAEIIEYEANATIYVYDGPDSSVVLANAIAGRDKYINAMRKLGRDVTRSGLNAAQFVEGVQRVVVADPAADVVCDDTQAAWCTARTTTMGGIAE